MAISDGISLQSASLPPTKTPSVEPTPLSSSTHGTSARLEAGHLVQHRRDVGERHELADHQHQHHDQRGPHLLAAEHAHLALKPAGGGSRLPACAA